MPNNIKSERARLNISQKELGDMLGVDESTIARWERDIAPVKAGYLRKLSEIFHCTTDYIIGRSDERTMAVVR